MGGGEGDGAANSNKKTLPKYHVTKPFQSVEQAWANLASDILLLAIEDARQSIDSAKSYRAKNWLRSPAARYLFEFCLPGMADIDINEWVSAGCPSLGKKWPKT